MSGIAGFCGSGNLKTLEAMTEAIAHRGPDGADYRNDLDIYVGHRRLAVLDLPGGHQPMTTVDGRYSIVFNGEIYNHLEIRRELESKGQRFQTDHSDTETLLLGFVAWGPEIQERLNGMWAFVIYDRQRRRLFGSRDRFGKKPFYYFHRAETFAFASELSALARHPEAPQSVSQLSLQKYFAFGYIPAPRTIFDGIYKLPAGHCCTFDVDKNELTLRKYWDYEPDPDPTITERRIQQVADELAATLEDAVRLRLTADVPLGVFLSGGLDSAAMSALALRHRGSIKSFTIGFEESSFDDTRSTAAVAKRLGTKHQVKKFSLETSKTLLPEIIGC